jgi:hypothetical protein
MASTWCRVVSCRVEFEADVEVIVKEIIEDSTEPTHALDAVHAQPLGRFPLRAGDVLRAREPGDLVC